MKKKCDFCLKTVDSSTVLIKGRDIKGFPVSYICERCVQKLRYLARKKEPTYDNVVVVTMKDVN